jgi:hypothetical protein
MDYTTQALLDYMQVRAIATREIFRKRISLQRYISNLEQIIHGLPNSAHKMM